jgi:NADH-quinone oxidoreductase subunit K
MNTEHYLILGSLVFCIGLFIVLTKNNAILILMGLELIFNASNINLVAVSNLYDGQIFALFIIVVAACELAIALALVYKIYHFFEDSDPSKYNKLGES